MKLKMFRRLAKSAVVALSLTIIFGNIDEVISTTSMAVINAESSLFDAEYAAYIEALTNRETGSGNVLAYVVYHNEEYNKSLAKVEMG